MPKHRTAETGEPAFSHRESTLVNPYIVSRANRRQAAIATGLGAALLAGLSFGAIDSG